MREPVGEGTYAEVFGCGGDWEQYVIKYGAKVAKREDMEDMLDGFCEMSGGLALADVTERILGHELYVDAAMTDSQHTYIRMRRGGRTLLDVIVDDAWAEDLTDEEREAIAAPLLADVACILHVAHLRGIWHQDVKLDNVLLFNSDTEDGEERACLIDWGFATHAGASHRKLRFELFALGSKPPELCVDVKKAKHRLSEKADVWAFGIMLLEILTEWDSTVADDEDEHMARIFKLVGGKNASTRSGLRKMGAPFTVVQEAEKWDSELGTLPEYCEDISASAQELICACLQFDPDDRLPMEGVLAHPFFASQLPRTTKVTGGLGGPEALIAHVPQGREVLDDRVWGTRLTAIRNVFSACEEFRYEMTTAFSAVALVDATVGTPAFFQSAGAAACVFASAIVHEPDYIEMKKFARRFKGTKHVVESKLRASLTALFNATGGYAFLRSPFTEIVHQCKGRDVTSEQWRCIETLCMELCLTQEWRLLTVDRVAAAVLAAVGVGDMAEEHGWVLDRV